MDAVAIEERLEAWEWHHPRYTPKTHKVRKTTPAWHKRLNDMEDYRPPPPAGILVSCGCPFKMRVPMWFTSRGKQHNNLERRCWICGQFRQVETDVEPSIPTPVLADFPGGRQDHL